MNDARNRMASLGREVKLLGIFRRWIERNMKLVDQYFLNEARPLMAEQGSRFRRAKSRPSNQNVRNKLLRLLVVPAVDDSALRPKCIAVLRFMSTRKQRNLAASIRSFPRRRKPAQPATNHKNVRLNRRIHKL